MKKLEFHKSKYFNMLQNNYEKINYNYILMETEQIIRIIY